MSDTYQALVAERRHRETVRENSARVAEQYISFELTGAGYSTRDEPVYFDTPFLREPQIAVGSYLVSPPDPDIWQKPAITGGVMRWVQNDRGFYLGAYLYFHVDTKTLDADVLASDQPPPVAVVICHFRFTALSYKKMSKTINDALTDVAIPPRELPSI